MIDNSNTAEMMLEVNQLISNNKIAGAIDLLDEILVTEPGFGSAYNHFGRMHDVKLKQPYKGEEHYKLAIKFNPEYASGYTNYAFLLSGQRRFT